MKTQHLHSKKQRKMKKYAFSQIGGLLHFILLFMMCSCSKFYYDNNFKQIDNTANPYTKKEFEKAKETGKAIPIEKQ